MIDLTYNRGFTSRLYMTKYITNIPNRRSNLYGRGNNKIIQNRIYFVHLFNTNKVPSMIMHKNHIALAQYIYVFLFMSFINELVTIITWKRFDEESGDQTKK